MALHPRIENFWDALLQPIVDSEGLCCSQSLHCNSNTPKAIIAPQHVMPLSSHLFYIPLKLEKISLIMHDCEDFEGKTYYAKF